MRTTSIMLPTCCLHIKSRCQLLVSIARLLLNMLLLVSRTMRVTYFR